MRLIIGDNEYKLIEINTNYFILYQDKPYIDFQFAKQEFGDNNYKYRSIPINGKLYGFSLIDKNKNV